MVFFCLRIKWGCQFDPMGFVMDKMALVRLSLQVPRFSRMSVIHQCFFHIRLSPALYNVKS